MPHRFAAHPEDHSSPPLGLNLPPGYRGPVYLPGNGRTVWWTGRVAIGLRHQAPQFELADGQSARWVQTLLLARKALA